MSRIAFSAILALSFLAACGPSQTAHDAEDDQERVYIEQQRQLLTPYVGCYSGFISPDVSGGQSNIVLRLKLSSITVASPSQNKMIQIPTIFGLAKMVSSDYLFASFNGNVVNGRLVTLPDSTGINPGKIDANLSGSRIEGLLIYGTKDQHETQVFLQREPELSKCDFTPQPLPPPKPPPPPHPKPSPKPPKH